MIAYAVTVEYRDPIGRIVTEHDSVWMAKHRAVKRRKEINSDPKTYPGMVADTVELSIRDFALAVPPDPQARPGRSKLTAEQVREMRERYAAGESLKELGRAFGISHQSVADIVNRETWRHV